MANGEKTSKYAALASRVLSFLSKLASALSKK